MITLTTGSLKTALAAVAAVGLTLAASGAMASTDHFTFNKDRYLPRSERLAAARTYIADQLTPGLPMAQARTIVDRTGAFCHAPGQDGAVSCIATTLQRRPGEPLTDVVWTVRIVPAADGAVAAATVDRH